MIIIWRADLDGGRDEFDAVDAKLKELGKEIGYTADRPYLPQDASMMYIMHANLDQMAESGPRFIPWLEETGISLTPLRYEVAQSPEEFWGT